MSTDNLLVYTSIWQAWRVRRCGESVIRIDGGYAVVSDGLRKIMKKMWRKK